MDEFGAELLRIGAVLLGVVATTWLGVAANTGPRRRVENIKVAKETLNLVSEGSPISAQTASMRIELAMYIERELSALVKLQDSFSRFWRRSSILGALFYLLGLGAWALGRGSSDPFFTTLMLVFGGIGAVFFIAAIVGILFRRRWYEDRQFDVVRLAKELGLETEAEQSRDETAGGE